MARKIWVLWSLIFWMSGTGLCSANAQATTTGSEAESIIKRQFLQEEPITNTYLPILLNGNDTPSLDLPLLLGIYPHEWPGVQSVFDNEFHLLDAWAGKGLSIAGTFVDFVSGPNNNLDWNITLQLSLMWENGYTPFLNLSTATPQMSAAYIANGGADNYLHEVAQKYLAYTDGEERMAFIAPFQEMNGGWVPYGLDPANYILAFQRIRQIFALEGVPAEAVRWVFAPNGSSPNGYPEFEAYYPGDHLVDAVGVTAYHFGYCGWAPPSWQGWHTPQVAVGEYLTRLVALSPYKPAFVAQTATSAYTQSGFDVNAKNQWLYDSYNFYTSFPTLLGIIYYNRWLDPSKGVECDWAFYSLNGDKFEGYKQGIANPAYGYLSPAQLQNADLSIP